MPDSPFDGFCFCYPCGQCYTGMTCVSGKGSWQTVSRPSAPIALVTLRTKGIAHHAASWPGFALGHLPCILAVQTVIVVEVLCRESFYQNAVTVQNLCRDCSTKIVIGMEP